jgi:hypothetical protein
MTPPDDILGKTSATESAKPGSGSAKPGKAPPADAPRVVGPESEDRGGPEVPADSLDDRQP